MRGVLVFFLALCAGLLAGWMLNAPPDPAPPVAVETGKPNPRAAASAAGSPDGAQMPPARWRANPPANAFARVPAPASSQSGDRDKAVVSAPYESRVAGLPADEEITSDRPDSASEDDPGGARDVLDLIASWETLDAAGQRAIEQDLIWFRPDDDDDLTGLLDFVESELGIEGSPGDPAAMGQLAGVLERALVASGHPQAVAWLTATDAESARPSLVRAIAGIKEDRGELVPGLIDVAAASPGSPIALAAITALGAIGRGAAYEAVMDSALQDDAARRHAVAALSGAASPAAWSVIREDVLFGDDPERRLIALESYARGYREMDKPAVEQLLAKVIANETQFPAEMVVLARDLLESGPSRPALAVLK